MAWPHRRNLIFTAGAFVSLGALGWYLLYRSSLTSSALAACTQISTVDVTQRLEVVGSPFTTSKYAKSDPYARNVWVMFPYQQKLYLGHGDSNNNQGPIPLWYLDSASQQFQFDFVAPEEQIRTFQPIDNALYTPGIDARENWKFGNIYHLKENGWQKMRTLPGGVHVWAIQGFARQLWSVIRRPDDRGYLLTSKDGGQTWSDVQVLRRDPAHMVLFQSSLYIFPGGRPWQVDQTLIPKPRQDLDLNQLFPGHAQATQVTQTATHQSQLAYLSNVSRYVSHTAQGSKVLNREDPHLQPPGLFVAQSLEPERTKVRRISLLANEVPWDILSTPQGLYVLTSERQNTTGQQRFVNRVRQATHPHQWCAILSFESEAFARSFARFQGKWYFGLGTDYGSDYGRKSYTQRAHPLSGTILRTDL